MSKIPLAVMERILKQGGAERVSEDSKEALAEVLEDYGLKIAKDAVLLCDHAGRKTVRKEDIKLASKRTIK